MKSLVIGAWRRMARLPLAVGVPALLVAVSATQAVAAERAESGLVTALRVNGAQVLSLGSRGGLDGYFVMPAEGAGYGLYVTGDGHAVAGLLYGPDGTEVTGDQLAAARGPVAGARDAPDRAVAVAGETGRTEVALAHAAPGVANEGPAAGTLTGLFERSASAFGFTLGDRGPVVVLLGDATCSWSRSAAARLGRAALDGWLQLRVVPVAVLGGAAARRAAAIAASPDPAMAWFEGGGTPDPAGAERIARNNALFDAWGADAVPLIAWRTRDGAVGHRVGDIDDVGAWLQETLVSDTLRVGDPRAGHPQGGTPSGWETLGPGALGVGDGP